ncbi:MAG TPA: hypothetical protein VN132_03415, partial [Bdellovibrio sp.]|nr:hypothetical protein [Bdellovibrio sp.]
LPMKTNYFLSFILIATTSLASASQAQVAQVTQSSLEGLLVGPGTRDISQHLLKPFVSDGCSMSPDGLGANHSWVDCCIRHDIAYWLGGTREDKSNADHGLKACIAKKGFPEIAEIYYASVATMGGPSQNTSYRWGYGWNYRRAYSPLTEDEIAYSEQIGESRETLMKLWSQGKIPVQNVSWMDPSLISVTENEASIYNFLRNSLTATDVVKKVSETYSYEDGFTFSIKLEHCSHEVILTLDETSHEIKAVKDSASCLAK